MPTDCLLCALWEPKPSAEKNRCLPANGLTRDGFASASTCFPSSRRSTCTRAARMLTATWLAVDLIHHAISAHRVIRPTVRLWRMLSTDSRLVLAVQRTVGVASQAAGSRLKRPFQSGT